MDINEAFQLARRHHYAGNLKEAEYIYREILRIQPSNAGAYYELGNVLQDKGWLDDALICYKEAIQLNPMFSESYNDLGNVFRKKGQFDEAIIYYRKAVELVPNFFGSYYNLGEALREKGRLDDAITCYQKAEQLNPSHVATINNLGTALREKGQIERAITHYRKAILLNPDQPDTHSNLAHALLLLGHLGEGWKEYEWRLKQKDFYVPNCSGPLKDDLSFKGKWVFVCSEQGVGDKIMFASCLPELIDQANFCTVECDKRLVPLFSRSFPRATFIECVQEGDVFSSAIFNGDIKIPIGSLPRYLRSEFPRFPQHKSYLVPDELKVKEYRNRLKAIGEGLKVGISWRGGPTPEIIRLRSISLMQLAKIFSTSGIHFINLQYGDCTAELIEAREKTEVTIHHWEDVDPLRDLDSFAAQIAALDLVISIDNSTIHMSGALGTPVWVLLPFVPNWRWMLNREDSPWYPTMRLFRQPSPGDWNSVIAKVADNLLKLLRSN